VAGAPGVAGAGSGDVDGIGARGVVPATDGEQAARRSDSAEARRVTRLRGLERCAP